MTKPRKDLTGMVFGRLTVLEQVEDYISPQGKHQTRWMCKCGCKEENIVFATTNNLKRKHQLSCGCLRKECMAKVGSAKIYNKCKFFKTYVVMYTSKGEEIYIDRCDYTKVKDYCWWITGKGYVLASDKNGGSIQLHRLIMDCPDDLLVDHIGGELTRNDNRRFNLRYATNAENCINKDIYPNNTSGVAGVSWIASKQKWVASIRIKNEIIALGHFTSLEEATQARKVAEEKYFGEWSYEKSQAIYKAGLAMYADDTIEDTSMCFDANRGYYCKECVA